MVIGKEEVPCGISNALLYFKNRVPTDEQIEKLQPMVLTHGGVPQNSCIEENNSPIMDDFNKKVVVAAEADDQTERQADEATIFKVSKDPKQQQEMAEAIYSRLVQMTQQYQE